MRHGTGRVGLHGLASYPVLLPARAPAIVACSTNFRVIRAASDDSYGGELGTRLRWGRPVGQVWWGLGSRLY